MGPKMRQAIAEGRTIFRQMVIEPPGTGKAHLGATLRVLKSAKSNAKIGRVMRKGPWRNMPLFGLTLEERATCPRTCDNWERCYGDNMHMALRHRHGPALLRALDRDLDALDRRFPLGYVVRLHVLGDFYSRDYVWWWHRQLVERPALRLYGYTHWQPGTDVGDAVTELVLDWRGRVSILRSDRKNADDPLPPAFTVPEHGVAAPGTVLCPVEEGRAASCGHCGLCMLGRIGVSFRDHGREAKQRRNIEERRAAKALRTLPVLVHGDN